MVASITLYCHIGHILETVTTSQRSCVGCACQVVLELVSANQLLVQRHGSSLLLAESSGR